MIEKIVDLLQNRGYLSSLLKLILLPVLLLIPYFLMVSIFGNMESLRFTNNVGISVIVIAVFGSYYGLILLKIPGFMQIIGNRVEMKIGVVLYFIFWITFVFLPSVLVFWVEVRWQKNAAQRPDFGPEFEPPFEMYSPLDNSLVVTALFIGLFVLCILGSLTSKILFFNKNHSIEELKTKLSPAAKKMYEKKSDNYS